MRYEFWLGLRYLFAKRKERFISIIALLSIGGVALGVLALIVVLSVMSGFDRDMTDRLIGTNAHIIVDALGGLRDVEPLLERVESLEHIEGVTPFVSGQTVLLLPGSVYGVILRGIDAKREPRVNQIANYVVFGHLPLKDSEVAIGTELSAMLQVGPGDTLRVASPVDGKPQELTVSGLFRCGMYDYDATVVIVSLERAQQLLRMNDAVTGLGVRADVFDRTHELGGMLQEELGPAYRVRTWTELNPTLFGALKVEKTIMFIILTLIIVVAALNILSMLIMIVMEKTKDIGILRALGATQGSVMGLFLWQGCVVGLFGISLGLAGGLGLASNLNHIADWLERTFGIEVFPQTVYYLDHIPTQINASDVMLVGGAALLLTVLASTYAAVRAARLSPVEALRYE